MADLYSIVHREAGPLRTFTSREDAERFLAEVRGDDAELAETLRLEPVELDA